MAVKTLERLKKGELGERGTGNDTGGNMNMDMEWNIEY